MILLTLLLDVRSESVGEADAVGDERDPRSDEFGSDQMLMGDESPIPSSQSIEFSLPIVFQRSISSGRIMIEADFEDVDEPDDEDEHVDEPVDDVICAPFANAFISVSFKSSCSSSELKPFL